MDEYNDIKDMLRPRRDFAASDGLRNKIDSTIDLYARQRKPSGWLWGVGVSCVAAAVLILILVPTGMSAKEILTETLDTLLNTQGVEMTVEVRTRPMENFRYINLSENFVLHRISVDRSDTAMTWRIDKGGRAAAGNNEVVYNWVEQLNIGWRTDIADPGELLGEMAILLTPEKILESELQNCINDRDAHYEVDKKDGEIILIIHSKPQGDFSNPYMLNASIAESENIRRYVIDAETRHLKSATVSVLNGIRESDVLRITNITYGQPRTNLAALPSGIRFIDMSRSYPEGLTGLSATEAASAFLNALETWNLSIIDSAVDENTKRGLFENDLKGSVLVSVGTSFASGNEGTTFVPYVLQLPDGTRKRHNLVLQKSSQEGWVVVGGL